MNTIKRGDCIREMQKLEAGSVDLVFADPPFNIGYDYDVYRDSLSAEKYLDWSRNWIGGVHRILKPDGTFWLAIGDEFAAELKIESQKIGFHCRSWVIWYYTFGVNCSRKFTRSHAHLFHFVKDPDNFVFRADELENRIPSARQLVYNDGRANSKGRLPDDTWIIRPADAIGEMTTDDGDLQSFDVLPRDDDRTWVLRPQDLDEGFKSDEDTWYFPRVAGTFKERAGFHGCQMPEQLLGRIIRVCSKLNDLVVDPFSGSGTTVAVAKKLGRRYLGFDLSQDYVRLGKTRLDSIRVGDPLDGSPEPKVSAPKTSRPRAGKAKTSTKHRKRDDRQELAVLEASNEQLRLTIEGVNRAFAETHDGYSADRVVADPALNVNFTAACRDLDLLGDARTWNMLLFRQRKGGKQTVKTTRTTTFDWNQCDEYLFASEIAWKMMIDERLAESLDEILCDPELATRFDGIARGFSPDRSSLEYRWAALKLRKQSKTARVQARSPKFKRKLRFEDPVPFDRFESTAVPNVPGVYLLGDQRHERRKIYLGETINLQSRLNQHLADDCRDVWLQQAHRLGIKPKNLGIWVRVIEADTTEMLVWQTRLVQVHKPSLNLLNV
jgi:site-specific DNA-methyltransferase (adenine-specific)